MANRLALVDKVNELLPKNGPHVLVKNGECFLAFVQIMLTPQNRYIGVSAIEKLTQTVPMEVLTSRFDIHADALNRFVLSKTLDAIADFGTEYFVSAVVGKIVPTQSVKLVKIDTTSHSIFTTTGGNVLLDAQSPLQFALDHSPLAVEYGYSRDNPKLHQINSVMLATSVPG